jgi:hypothetical protein
LQLNAFFDLVSHSHILESFNGTQCNLPAAARQPGCLELQLLHVGAAGGI